MSLRSRCLAGCCVAALLGFGVMSLPRAAANDAPTTAPSTQPTAAVNTKCPVSGDAVDPTVTTVYKGKTYAFCCSDCVKAFKKDPQKYLANAK